MLIEICRKDRTQYKPQVPRLIQPSSHLGGRPVFILHDQVMKKRTLFGLCRGLNQSDWDRNTVHSPDRPYHDS